MGGGAVDGDAQGDGVEGGSEWWCGALVSLKDPEDAVEDERGWKVAPVNGGKSCWSRTLNLFFRSVSCLKRNISLSCYWHQPGGWLVGRWSGAEPGVEATGSLADEALASGCAGSEIHPSVC